MHGRLNQWLAWTPVVAVMVCGFSATARGQANRLSVDPAYQMPVNSTQMAPNYPTTAANNYMVSSTLSADEKGLADEVAELKAWKKKVEDKEKADKKKAAGSPSVKVGGRIMTDWASFDQNPVSRAQAGDAFNGTEFRRARLEASGDAFDVVDYKVQMDFSGEVAFKDVYMTVKELPALGNVRVGHFYEKFALETQTSSKYITFMERSLISELGEVGGRKTGIAAFDWSEDENWTWGIGAFTTVLEEVPPIFPFAIDDDNAYDDAGGTCLSGRITHLLWYDEATEGRGLLHTGISYSYRDIPEVIPGDIHRYRIRQRPEAHLAPRVVDTGYIEDASTINAFEPELAYVYGPFSFQTEYLAFWLDRTANDQAFFHGAYAYVSYFLTGENRTYERKEGIFGRVKPLENFFRVRTEDGSVGTGKGAWELAYRWSYVDLTDAGIRGGRVTDHTLGLNWYLNPYARLMFNYVNSQTTDRGAFAETGCMNVFETRAQIDF
jgi:phosphate-selective porin OprO/OprP